VTIQPATVRLKGGDSQAFTCDKNTAHWSVSDDKAKSTDGPMYLYKAPAKYRVWFSRDVVVTAEADGEPAVSAVITLVSTPAWIAALTVFYVALFLALVIGVFVVWPPAPAVPWVELSPPMVTIAPGYAQQFEARVWNARDQGVTWSVTDGLITPSGLFTAPSAGNRVLLTVTSSVDSNLKQSGVVLLNAHGLSVWPTTATLGPGLKTSFKAVVPYQSVPNASVAQNNESGPKPAVTGSDFEWTASDLSLRLNPGADGTVEVEAPKQVTSLKRVLVIVIDKTDRTRQAGALLYLAPREIPLGEDVSEAELLRDKGLLKLVLLMGALGALLGASRSFGNFVGNDAFVPTWTIFYLFRPTFGAGLGLLVFFGYRIGAVAGFKGAAPADPFAATFVAGMVGLFADTVLQKLKDLVSALFPTQDERKDKVAASVSPVIQSAEASEKNKKMTIRGRNFAAGASVIVNGKARTVTFISSNELAVVLEDSDKAGDVKVVVTNPDKQASAEFAARINE